jgi:hypothetical protein
MNVSYETQGFDTYLVCAIDGGVQLDTAAVGMLTNNRARGLAPVIFTKFDETRYLKYLVTAKITAARLFAGVIGKRGLLDFLSSICAAMTEASDYMLDANRLIWDMDYIFADASGCQAEMIYMPLADTDGNIPDIVGFFRNVIMSAQYGSAEDKGYIGEIISYLSAPASFSPDGFEKLLTRLKNSPSNTAAPQQTAARRQGAFVREQRPRIAEARPNFGNQSPFAQKGARIPEQPAYIGGVRNSFPAQAPSSGPEDAPMSLFYLLQHYNAQNKAAYDAQRKRKKESARLNPTKKPMGGKGKGTEAEAPPSFAIPGREGSMPAQARSDGYAANFEPRIQYSPPAANGGGKLDFGDTVYVDAVAEEPDGTVLFDMPQARASSPHMARARNNERIPINKPLFRFGRSGAYADYVVGDNKYIGAAHCHILSRDGEYFVIDDNSKNHTYVDGAMIPGSTEFKINHGTKIRMADEEFEFRLY